ncbi:MAG: Rieske (2Fe-2S) protein [Acidimicrobiia bacterium]
MAEFVTVAAVHSLEGKELAAFAVKGSQIAVANVAGSFYAFSDTCTHLQCSLTEGELEGTTVTCSCHGSQFDVTTGAVLRGPARDPERSYATRVENGVLQVEV